MARVQKYSIFEWFCHKIDCISIRNIILTTSVNIFFLQQLYLIKREKKSKLKFFGFFFIHFSWESNPGNHNILINSFRNPIFWCQWLFSDPYKATVALLCTSCHVCEKWVGPGKLALRLPETVPHLSTERILFSSTVSSIEVVRQGMFFSGNKTK